MKSRFGPAVGLFVTITAGNLAAQQPACSLLTPADIEAATGTKAGPGSPADIPITKGPAKGQTMFGCMWSIAAEHGMVNINVMPAATGPAREAGLARIRQAFDVLKAQQWTEERKDYGAIRCSIMTPPGTAKNVPMMSGCLAEAKGMALSAGFMSPTKKLTLDQAKALLDKVLAHLK